MHKYRNISNIKPLFRLHSVQLALATLRYVIFHMTSNVIHPYSPNIDLLEDAESEMYWIQFSDFYDWPHIQYFDDYEHLKKLLLDRNFTLIRDLMKQELALRKKQITRKWCEVINIIGETKEKF